MNYFKNCCKDCERRWIDYNSTPARTCKDTCKEWKEAREAKDKENDSRRKFNDTYKKKDVDRHRNNIRTKSLMAITKRGK